jgi:putative ABC transport system substrate-binding protein
MIGEDQGWVKLGQLISYGATLECIWYRGAYYVDKILKGARPADLPVELPTVIKLTVNLKTARLFGLELPPVILAAADETVE